MASASSFHKEIDQKKRKVISKETYKDNILKSIVFLNTYQNNKFNALGKELTRTSKLFDFIPNNLRDKRARTDGEILRK
jgi:hypothetical protein